MLCTTGSKTNGEPTRRFAVLVVHGIGQQRRGECAGALAQNIYRALCQDENVDAITPPHVAMQGREKIQRIGILRRGSKAATAGRAQSIEIDLHEFYWGPLACSHVSLLELATWAAAHGARFVRCVLTGGTSRKAVFDGAQIVAVGCAGWLLTSAAVHQFAGLSLYALILAAWLLVVYGFMENYLADVLRYFCVSEYRTHYRVRRRIQRAGLRKLRELLCTQGVNQYDDVMIVAHSLGTVVAVDLLRRWPTLVAPGSSSRLRSLITLGSPLSKCACLKLGDEAPTSSLPRSMMRTIRWTNIYYALDPVADALSGVREFGVAIHDVSLHARMPFLCHMKYWSDARVARLLIDELLLHPIKHGCYSLTPRKRGRAGSEVRGCVHQ
jgi:hypothetical protein